MIAEALRLSCFHGARAALHFSDAPAPSPDGSGPTRLRECSLVVSGPGPGGDGTLIFWRRTLGPSDSGPVADAMARAMATGANPLLAALAEAPDVLDALSEIHPSVAAELASRVIGFSLAVASAPSEGPPRL